MFRTSCSCISLWQNNKLKLKLCYLFVSERWKSTHLWCRNFMRSRWCAVQNKGLPEKWFYRPLEIPATKKTIHPTTSDKNLETLGKFRSLSFLLSLLLCCCGRVTLQSTSPHCRGKGKSTGVSRIFGEDCRHCVVPCQNADVMHNLSTSYGAWNLSSYLPRRKEAGFPLFESIVAIWSGAIPIFLIIHAAFFWLDAAFIYR